MFGKASGRRAVAEPEGIATRGRSQPSRKQINGSVSLAEGVSELPGVSARPQKTLRMRPSVRDEVAGMSKRGAGRFHGRPPGPCQRLYLARLGGAVAHTPG